MTVHVSVRSISALLPDTLTLQPFIASGRGQ